MKPAIKFAWIIVAFSSIGRAAEFQSDYIDVETVGSGPDIVLLSGLASSPLAWTNVADELKKAHRLHLVSVSGFAGKPAAEKGPESYIETLRDEIARYIDEQTLNETVLIGHSMGGLVSLLVAGNESANVRQVIIVDSLPLFSLLFNPNATSESVSPQALAMEKQLTAMSDEQFKAVAVGSASILTKNPERRKTLEEWINASDRKMYAQATREVLSYDARPRLKSISCPVAVIYAYDKAMPVPQQQLEVLYKSAYSGVKDLKVLQVSDSYHFIMWDNPRGLIAAISGILSAKSGGAAAEQDKTAQ